MNNGFNVPVESLIDHIKTASDVDPWAKEMIEKLLIGRVEAKKIARLDNESNLWRLFCSKCKAEVDNGDLFCRDCGSLFTGITKQTTTNRNKQEQNLTKKFAPQCTSRCAKV